MAGFAGKQNTWEQNSLSAIQTGILQWNQSITGLENDKLTYLNGIEQTKAQWLANKQIIQNAQTQMRSALQSTITNIRSQENQLKANASSDPGLTSVFGDMDELLEDLQDALNSNASLGTLAQTLGNFFQNQISNATSKADYWNTTKWQETYATQVLDFKKESRNSELELRRRTLVQLPACGISNGDLRKRRKRIWLGGNKRRISKRSVGK
ncbi:hypothetical protein LEP1GSC071_0617 [Leptospira santarosai str. JET]|nr:hypothetical protein LEP1GSC071_0617 [Leptospira santarosai str. JET]